MAEIRETFNKILDGEMDKNPPENSTYIKKQVAQKFKENALEGDYETKEDLKEVAKEINEKYGGKVNYKGELIWFEKLRRELYGYS